MRRLALILSRHRIPVWTVGLAGAFLAIIAARPYAGSWNDGSRLATVEALVDRHTLAIDDSIFVRVPGPDNGKSPYYSAEAGELLQKGTQDRLLIAGHYYSDKSPVPALLHSGVYALLQGATGLKAAETPDRFCFWMNLLSSGLAYVIAVVCIHRLGSALMLPPALQTLVTTSFGLCTLAPAYAEHVNNHTMLLAVTSALMLILAHSTSGSEGWSGCRVLLVGFLSGLGYSIDLGLGPVLVLVCLGYVVWKSRNFRTAALFLLGTMPFFVLHHVVNYQVGGTFGPANSNAAYFEPGSPFGQQNMTGVWQHDGPGHFLLYAVELLFGKRGFLGHNLPLLLCLPVGAWLALRRKRVPTEIIAAIALSMGTWLLYAAASNNYSGACCSIRWFLPLLAPGYLVLAWALRERPEWTVGFAWLSFCGAVLSALACRVGPWTLHVVPGFWIVLTIALMGWGYISAAHFRWQRRRPSTEDYSSGPVVAVDRAA